MGKAKTSSGLESEPDVSIVFGLGAQHISALS